MNESLEPQAPSPPTARPASAIAALLLLTIVFVVGIVVGQSRLLTGAPVALPTGHPQATPSAGVPQSPAALDGFDLFLQALGVIRENFVGRAQLADNDLTYGAIRGLVEALGDTGHSTFLTPAEVLSEQNALSGSVVGVGILLGTRNDAVVVLSVISGAPAQRAGVRAGDRITAVDGESVTGLAPDQVAARVRGEAGSEVRLTLERPATGEQLELAIVRERITVPATSWAMVPGTRIADLRLNQFSTGAAAELKAARDAAIAAGAQALILDLRGNPGGYVDEAIDVASLFLPGGTVYIRETADGERIPALTNEAIGAVDLPLIVLVDGNTASSSEIVAGAIQSAGRAQIIGQTTFGTGTVLHAFDLADGSSIRLAVERWLTPDGELIFGKGITPTELVEMALGDAPIEPDQLRDLTPAEMAALGDPQLTRAIDLLGP